MWQNIFPISKKPGEAAAKTAVVFQAVCREKKNATFHTEVYLKTELFLHWLKGLFNCWVVHSERNILNTQTLTQWYHTVFVSCGSYTKRHLAVTWSKWRDRGIKINRDLPSYGLETKRYNPFLFLCGHCPFLTYNLEMLNLPFETWNPSIILDKFLWKLNLFKNMGKMAHIFIDIITINSRNQTLLLQLIIFFLIW